MNNIRESTLKISLISNIILEPYFGAMISKKFAGYKKIDLKTVDFLNILSESFDARNISNADYVIVCLNFDCLYPNCLNKIIKNNNHNEFFQNSVKMCENLYNYILQNSRAEIIWFGFEDYCYEVGFIKPITACINGLIDKINLKLSSMIKSKYIDFKKIIAQVGIDNSYYAKGKYRWNSPYSKDLIQQMVDEIFSIYASINGITKKCLILDCDNVLWGGILSEDGIHKIQLSGSSFGRVYQEFQQFVELLYYHGIIIAICSKNDLSDVLQVFKEHNGMILKKEQIACFMVNWGNKPSNIIKIAETLNIDLNSLVFVDDSDFEIESVKSTLPQVETIKFEKYSNYFYKKFECFCPKKEINITEIDLRNNTYRTNEQRNSLKETSASFEEYLQALEMSVEIKKTQLSDVARISELSQRTNKCTNGKRYTTEQIVLKMKEDEYSLYTITLSDKFSDLGIVGVIGIEKSTLDLFSLSCRALGRGIEEKMIEYAYLKGAKNYHFEDTGKNLDLRNKFSSRWEC